MFFLLKKIDKTLLFFNEATRGLFLIKNCEFIDDKNKKGRI